MEAGMIDYRLCELSFDCEHCPLDLAIRGGAGASTVIPSDKTEIPESVRFHRSHIWINETPAGAEWTLGLDHHALRAFSGDPTFSLPRPGRHIASGEELFSLIVEDEALRWPAPCDLMVLERNDRWFSEVPSLRASPYREGWAVLAKLASPPPGDWLDAAAMDAINRAESEALKELIFAGMKARDAIGRTAPDGGVLIAPPDRVLELRDYMTFLREWWHLLPAER
jgi:glycine cleavage system H lipoate-binding protein